jgi:hypothetical protein
MISTEVSSLATYNKQSSVRLLLATAAIMSFEVISADVTQAYRKSASELKRKVFVKPNCIDLKPDELLQIMKPITDSSKAVTIVPKHLFDITSLIFG